MTERETAINRDLRVLDDAHRLGRISREEYRSRRRRVLQPLADSGGVVTARKALVPPRSSAPPQGQHAVAAGAEDAGHALTALLSIKPTLTWKAVLILVLGVALVVGFGSWMLLRA